MEDEGRTRATVTVPEASKLLGISRNHGYALARAGGLPGQLRLGRRIVVSKQALNRILDGQYQLPVIKT